MIKYESSLKILLFAIIAVQIALYFFGYLRPSIIYDYFDYFPFTIIPGIIYAYLIFKKNISRFYVYLSIYLSATDEFEVNVNVGDVIIGDSRLIHGSFPNQSCEERTLITLWYHPNFRSIPKGIKARICEIFNRKEVDTDPEGTNSMTLANWPDSSRQSIQDLFPSSSSGVEPQPWCRIPHWPK